MINNFSIYLALRYLRPKRTFVSVITVISVLGVTLGVGVLIVVISVMASWGWSRNWKRQGQNIDDFPHLGSEPQRLAGNEQPHGKALLIGIRFA